MDGTPFDNDEWELYNLNADFNECHDLAAVEPGRYMGPFAFTGELERVVTLKDDQELDHEQEADNTVARN